MQAESSHSTPPSAPATKRKLLLIGIDGCRPDCLTPATAPVLLGLSDPIKASGGARRDARVLDAFTCDISISAPGWCSVLTGVWAEKHKIYSNEQLEEENVNQVSSQPPYRTFLERVSASDVSTRSSCVFTWGPLGKYCSPAQVTTHKEDHDTLKDALAQIKLSSPSPPDLLFVHFDCVDAAGHYYGFEPDCPEYLHAIKKADTMSGELFAAVAERACKLAEEWLILITTDHGGTAIPPALMQQKLASLDSSLPSSVSLASNGVNPLDLFDADYKGFHGLDIPLHKKIFIFLTHVLPPSSASSASSFLPSNTSHTSASIVDVAPTVCDFLLRGRAPPSSYLAHMDGKSLLA